MMRGVVARLGRPRRIESRSVNPPGLCYESDLGFIFNCFSVYFLNAFLKSFWDCFFMNLVWFSAVFLMMVKVRKRVHVMIRKSAKSSNNRKFLMVFSVSTTFGIIINS